MVPATTELWSRVFIVLLLESSYLRIDRRRFFSVDFPVVRARQTTVTPSANASQSNRLL
jgi:hypothetical protein